MKTVDARWIASSGFILASMVLLSCGDGSVQARRVVLKDESGRTRLVLEATDGGPRILLQDEDEVPRVTLALRENSPSVLLTDRAHGSTTLAASTVTVDSGIHSASLAANQTVSRLTLEAKPCASDTCRESVEAGGRVDLTLAGLGFVLAMDSRAGGRLVINSSNVNGPEIAVTPPGGETTRVFPSTLDPLGDAFRSVGDVGDVGED